MLSMAGVHSRYLLRPPSHMLPVSLPVTSYQLNQLGSKAASDSTLKQLTLAGYQILVLYCTVLYCTVLYCTVLYCTVLYCTVLYMN